MCSVLGYVGAKLGRAYVLDGFMRLEHRGYRLAGLACFSYIDKSIKWIQAELGIDGLKQQLQQSSIDGHVIVGYARWQNYGGSTEHNAHPHFHAGCSISVVHNGIIENYSELKHELLQRGHVLSSDTDAEVIAHYLAYLISINPTLHDATVQLVEKLQGAFAFVCMLKDYPEKLLLIRKGSPLCVGIGDREMYIASDIASFQGYTDDVVFLPEESFALVGCNSLYLYNFLGAVLPIKQHRVTDPLPCSDKQGYEHYMLKEIYEQRRIVYDTVSYFRSYSDAIFTQLNIPPENLSNLTTITFIGCGTSWHAGLIGAHFMQKVARVSSQSHLASEFRYMPIFISEKSIYCALSQSGETIDTLEALKVLNKNGALTIAVTNVLSSSMVRESGGFLLTRTYQEVAIASTKSFSAQIVVLYWLAHYIALHKNYISQNQLHHAEDELLVAAEILENMIERYKYDITYKHASLLAKYQRCIFLGCALSYPFALEAALKLKEISYMFVDCYPVGELQHGALALLNQDVPVVIFSLLDDFVYKKIVSTAQEAKLRGCILIVFAFEGQVQLIELGDIVYILPQVAPLLAPLAMMGLMQFFVYQVAVCLGRPIDSPRDKISTVHLK